MGLARWIRSAALCCALLLAASPARGVIEVFTVTPLQPACDEEVLLAAEGYFSDQCWIVTGHELVPVGSDLWLVIHAVDLWPEVSCGLAIYEYSVSETVGPLASGFYEAIAWEDVQSERVPQGDLVVIPFLACCDQPPAPVTDLRVEQTHGGNGLRFTWTDVPWTDAYHLYQDTSPQGSFVTPVGSATTGVTGIDAPLPAESVYYLLSSSNDCGEGPKH